MLDALDFAKYDPPPPSTAGQTPVDGRPRRGLTYAGVPGEAASAAAGAAAGEAASAAAGAALRSDDIVVLLSDHGFKLGEFGRRERATTTTTAATTAAITTIPQVGEAHTGSCRHARPAAIPRAVALARADSLARRAARCISDRARSRGDQGERQLLAKLAINPEAAWARPDSRYAPRGRRRHCRRYCGHLTVEDVVRGTRPAPFESIAI